MIARTHMSLAIALGITLACTDTALACSVCGGDPESKMAQGATQGVLVMVLIVYALLMGMCGVLLTWILRARKLSQPQVVH